MKDSNSTTTPLIVATPSRGTVAVAIGGAIRSFKFGFNALAAFGQLYEHSPLDFAEQFTKNPVCALRDMAYCGLLMRAAENELPEGFSPQMVGDWIDDMEQSDWNTVQNAMLGSLTLKNSPQ